MSIAMEGEIKMKMPEFQDVPNFTVQASVVSVFNQCHQP